MLPFYKRGVRYVSGSIIRTKQQATLFCFMGAVLVCGALLSLYSWWSDGTTSVEGQRSETTTNTTTPESPLSPISTVFPFVSGLLLGFVGSIPVAGPTSALILKLGIQGQYWSGRGVAIGGACAEAVRQE